jgi:hypothetical protein
MKTVVFVVIFSAVTLPVAAQWLNHPTPGIRRTANGKPNLTAAAAAYGRWQARPLRHLAKDFVQI